MVHGCYKSYENVHGSIVKDPISSAPMFCSKRRRVSSPIVPKIVQNTKIPNEFTDLAIGVLKECQKENENNTHLLLIRRVSEWGKTSCILIAVEGKNEDFIDQPECQDLFRSIWNGEMTQANGILKLIICTLIPPLIPCWVNFKEDEDYKLACDEQEAQKSKLRVLRCTCNRSLEQSNCSLPAQEDNDDSEHDSKVDAKRLGIGKKFLYFYRAPVVVFCQNVITYVAFLFLYSYILICHFEENMSVIEYLLIVWVFTLVYEEFRQVSKWLVTLVTS
ncbi:hypothetical protein CHS0354_034630 [Potamilus streckersoni]|uniref:TRPM-like domain-containing protein n=1 Tax=Potamilus streckersoni TaxID=2493646 RepID=A0AAE0TBZ9_9BIVA|nr:hypothetical protein CHS0354_034630 [Potamilus streckersoni]